VLASGVVWPEGTPATRRPTHGPADTRDPLPLWERWPGGPGGGAPGYGRLRPWVFEQHKAPAVVSTGAHRDDWA